MVHQDDGIYLALERNEPPSHEKTWMILKYILLVSTLKIFTT